MPVRQVALKLCSLRAAAESLSSCRNAPPGDELTSTQVSACATPARKERTTAISKRIKTALADFVPVALLVGAAVVQGTEAAENDQEPPPPPVDPVALATRQLGANVERLRGTLKWVGGLIVAALLAVAYFK